VKHVVETGFIERQCLRAGKWNAAIALERLLDHRTMRFADDDVVKASIHIGVQRFVALLDAALAEDAIAVGQRLTQRIDERTRSAAFGHPPRGQSLERPAHIECIENVIGAEATHDVAARLVHRQQSFLCEHRQCLAHRCSRHAEHFRQRRLGQPLAGRQLGSQNHLANANQGAGLMGVHAARTVLMARYKMILHNGIPTVNAMADTGGLETPIGGIVSESFDVVTVGSGHNGLVAAAYLAAAGRKVLVLERNAWFGGGVVTRELTQPGFRHDQHSMAHIFIQGSPLLRDDELKLKARYGLSYVFPDPPVTSIFEDGQTLSLYRDRERTAAEIANFSKSDASAYIRLSEQAAAWLPMIAATLYSAPMPLGASMAMLDQSREGQQLWRVGQMSTHELLCRTFENDRVRMHFARIAGENLVAPDEKGTGLGVYVFLGFLEAYGFGVPVGGSGTLTGALIRCIEDHGGRVLADMDVELVLARAGRAVGVRVRNGREFAAKEAVIAAIHPHHLGRLVQGIDTVVAADAASTEISANACITLHAALREPLRTLRGQPLRSVMVELLPARYEVLRRSFDDLRYGQLSQYPLIGLGSLSEFDDSRAPAGNATLHAWDYVPYERPDGRSWDLQKGEYVQRMLGHMARFLPNLTADNILGWHCDSPLDMERTSSSFVRGDLHGIAMPSYQLGSHRPTPQLGQFIVPGTDRLYLVGPFQHPGGGVFGAGRAAAERLCADLKIDFARIARIA
jgi:phytoene dehydrogenase-like protein